MRIERRTPLKATIGILGVGHAAYWPQFDGLLDVMHQKMDIFRKKVEKLQVDVVDFGIVDDSASAYRALKEIRKHDLDLLFVDMVTYATSATFAPLIQSLDIPIVLVALQPLAAMDYARGTTFIQLCNDDVCSVPEFCSVAVRMGKRVPEVIIGTLEGDAQADEEVASWCRIAHVLHDLKTARIGLMGHVLDTMYDMHVDPALITRTFGCHVVPLEPEQIMVHYRNSDPTAVATMVERIKGFFDTPDPVSDNITFCLKQEDLDTAARAAVALELAIEEKNLTGLAYYYEAEEGSEMRRMVTNFIVGNSLLTGAGFPMCGEFDLKTCMAMLIMDRLEIGGSFAEFHPMDFKQGSILVGHDGPHHINIADRKPVLRSLSKYHGKPGSGAGVEFKIKEGPLTMLGITVNAAGLLKFVVAEGDSLQGDIPPTGNTNTHGFFQPDLKTFLKRWMAEAPTHHFALGIGHHAHEIEKIANVLGIDCVVIPTH
ncbi:MAG: L-fucose/L-arabinose isomerase family protein [Rhodoferax sp.]|uniref:L-fucose/L-arabinose isomerase family protein n=1 Tax=Rhodoferax sp. TaxID=50421 RepID=UPI00272FE6F0|nr:L-fucose/L-arabinose isomerase family protein [Rhodoferax sp.]MDP1531177.1 L-fucose/L-arabinose isomerase family protein [Rhodoferax sp.]MDP1942227.1 L-fucose/L-arabinose isomerase family protein [Rhodoferax sp.]